MTFTCNNVFVELCLKIYKYILYNGSDRKNVMSAKISQKKQNHKGSERIFVNDEHKIERSELNLNEKNKKRKILKEIFINESDFWLYSKT